MYDKVYKSVIFGLVAILFPLHAFAAIAFVASCTANNQSGDQTLSLAAGSDTLILGFYFTDSNGADVITGMTWNGNAMTQIAKIQSSGGTGTFYQYIYAIAGSDTGTHNVVTTGITAGGGSGSLNCAAYSGTALTNPTNVVTASVNNISQASISTTITISDSNSWLVVQAGERTNGGDSFTGTPTLTDRGSAASGWSYADSNTTVTAGAKVPIFGGGGLATHWAMTMVEIQVPATVTVTPKGYFWMPMWFL